MKKPSLEGTVVRKGLSLHLLAVEGGECRCVNGICGSCFFAVEGKSGSTHNKQQGVSYPRRISWVNCSHEKFFNRKKKQSSL